jgi:hypothetical protein
MLFTNNMPGAKKYDRRSGTGQQYSLKMKKLSQQGDSFNKLAIAYLLTAYLLFILSSILGGAGI